MAILIKPQALEELVRSVRLWYPKEAYGFLHGSEKMVIERATDIPNVPLRTVEAVDSADAYEKNKDVLTVERGPIEGDYHPHTQASTYLANTECSDDDVKDMLKHPEWVYFIVAARETKGSSSQWKHRKDGELSTRQNGLYLRVAAYLKSDHVRIGRASRREFERVPLFFE